MARFVKYNKYNYITSFLVLIYVYVRVSLKIKYIYLLFP